MYKSAAPYFFFLLVLFSACQLSKDNPSKKGTTEKYTLEEAKRSYEEKHYEKALLLVDSLLLQDSTQIDAHLLKADVLMDYYKSDEALSVLEKLAQMYPQNDTVQLKLARQYLILKDYPSCEKTCIALSEKDKANPEPYILMALSYKEQGEQNQAIESLKIASKYAPDRPEIWIALAELHETSNPSLAEKYYKNALSSSDWKSNSYDAYAGFLQKQNRLEESIQVYNQLLETDSTYINGYYNRGLLKMDLDQHESALSDFEKVIALDPLMIKAYYYRAINLELTGQEKEALEAYKDLKKRAPNFENAQLAIDYLSKKLNQ